MGTNQWIWEQERMAALECVLTDDAIETSAIECEILRRSSVRSSIRKRIGLPVEQEDWDDHADGLVTMLFDARHQKPSPLTKERLLGWHAALFPTGYSGLKKIHVGRYRGDEEMHIVSGPFGKETVHYVAPPQSVLEEEMDRFLNWVNSDDEYNPLIKAGIAHLWFILIHPFDDGNGRVGRAITDYIMSINYPSLMQVISVSKHFSLDRKGYYRVLETSISAMREAHWIVDRVVMKAQFWQLHKDAVFNQRQLNVINRLFDDGEKFEGGMTTRKYAGMTKCSKVSASCDLAELLNKGIIQKNKAGGRSTSYEIRETHLPTK